MLQNYTVLYGPKPEQIVYAYSMWQKDFAKSRNDSNEFIRDVDQILKDYGFTSHNTPTLLMLDDLVTKICENKEAAALFTKDVHHKNITILFLSRNLSRQGRDYAKNYIKLPMHNFVKISPRYLANQYFGRQLGIQQLALPISKALRFPTIILSWIRIQHQ